MNSKAWNIKLSDGTTMPILGLGTYKSPSEDLIKIVTRALEIGYRHFDSADYYKVRFSFWLICCTFKQNFEFF